MAEASPPAAAKPFRVWPVALLAAVYWAFQLVLALLDVSMFARFLSNVISSALFLLVFLILWLANGTVQGRLRLFGLGALIGGTALGIVLSHPSFEPFGFVMAAVPYALTAWAAWMIAGRLRPRVITAPSLAGVILLAPGVFDLFRWDGLDARLLPSYRWRWSPTTEQAFLASKAPSPAAPERSARPWTPGPGDCPEFRGVLRDGVFRGVRVTAGAPQQVWKRRVGPGWSSMIVVGGFLVTQEQRGDWEAIVCYDAETGAEAWCHQDAARFHEGIAGPGPRATPTFSDGRIYALGGAGLLTCLEAATGKRLWSRDLAREAGGPLPMWGFSASPLVVDGKVLVFVGGEKARGLVALDASTGGPIWSREGGKESYSSAHLVTLGGKPQVLIHDNKRLAGVALADGAVLWERPGESESVIPMLQPCALPDEALLVAYGTAIALLGLKDEAGRWTVTEKWTSRRLKPSFNDFVVHEGRVYGLDDGVLCCIDLKDGERVWKNGRYGGGQVVLVAESALLIVLSEKGELAFVEARPQDPGDVPRFPALEGKTWNHPVVVRDRLYVRNGAEMACYRLRTP